MSSENTLQEGDPLNEKRCIYCNRVAKGKQATLNNPICYTCYDKLRLVRKLRGILAPYKRLLDERNSKK